jgi:hypothetical protein
LLVGSLSPALSASWQVNQAQQLVSEDAILICTGNQFKWISSEAFYHTGQLVFIEPPADTPSSAHSIDCSFNYVNDKDSSAHFAVLQAIQTLAYFAATRSIIKRPYIAYPYQTGQTRAPPTVS